MIRVAIVEDDLNDAGRLISFLSQFEGEKKVELKPTHFQDAESFLKTISDEKFDIVFMDIEMPGMDGLSCAAEFRKIDGLAALIFITNMAQFAIRGYEVDALDFVVKPIDYFPFKVKLEKALRLVSANPDSKTIIVAGKKGTEVLRLSEVTYVESDGHSVIYHTANGEYRDHTSLRDAEGNLSPYGFSRISGSFIVNLRHVNEVRNNEVKLGEILLPLSRSKKKDFLDDFATFLGGK